MGILRDPLGHASPPGEQSLHTGGAPPAPAVSPSSQPPAASGGDDGRSELRSRRDALAEQVAEMHWDLGGLAYEMAIRDHYRLDVLARKASELQEADAQLGEVQRMLANAEAGVDGQCRSCGAVHSRGAAYCWHCGAPLLHEARPTVLHGEQGAG
jgi:hypothetical protein